MDGPDSSLLLIAPDWHTKDTLLKHPLPFVLWPVGDQPLLAHWFDDCFNRGITDLEIRVADRPNEVREYCEQATLWPISIKVIPVKSSEPSDSAIIVDHLPWQQPPVEEPGAAWGLLDYWRLLEREWFDHFLEQLSDPRHFLSIGRHCQIHPGAILVPPYWIGDEVLIGPGCEIGPHATIGNGSLLAGSSKMENARLGDNTYLAADTELKDAVLFGGTLINLRLRSVLNNLDPVIGGTVSQSPVSRVTLWQRLRAIRLQSKYRKAAQSVPHARQVRTLDNRLVKLLDHPDPFVARWPMYQHVIKGKLPLVGLPPYPAEELSDINTEWMDILRRVNTGVFGLSDFYATGDTPIEERILHDVYQASGISETEAKTLVMNFIDSRK